MYTSCITVLSSCLLFHSIFKTQKDNYEFLLELYEQVLGKLTEGTVWYACAIKNYSEVHVDIAWMSVVHPCKCGTQELYWVMCIKQA